MQKIRYVLKYIVIFFAVTALMAGGLVLSALIPQSAIHENVLESAKFLCEEELFGEVIEGVDGSRIDRYADSVLLAIAYQYESEHPLESVMASSYYYTKYQNENKNLLDAVMEGKEPNQQYLRYWHGSNIIVRLLLLFLDIQQIYFFNGIVLAVLALWLLLILYRKKAYIPAVAVSAGLTGTACWFVPLSLEYTWTYMLMLILSVIGVKRAWSGKWNNMGILFLLSGMWTNYMDFLTTETLTLLIPLLLVLWIDIHMNTQQSIIHIAKNAGKAAVVWLLGYCGTWGMKWLLASIVLKENVLPYVVGHIQERIGSGRLQNMCGAVMRNIKCLFPIQYGLIGMLAGGLLILLAAYIGYVYHKKCINKQWILLLALIGIVPYIRYIVLCNHSYLHYFFTYRAQMATVAAGVMILGEMVDWSWLRHAYGGRKKS